MKIISPAQAKANFNAAYAKILFNIANVSQDEIDNVINLAEVLFCNVRKNEIYLRRFAKDIKIKRRP